MKALKQPQIPMKLRASIGGFLGTSHSIELNNGGLIYTTLDFGWENPESMHIRPTESQWRKFRIELDDLKIWQWQTEYPNNGVRDGTQWSLEIEYGDKHLITGGDNNYPCADGSPNNQSEPPTLTFVRYLKAVEELLGGMEFQ